MKDGFKPTTKSGKLIKKTVTVGSQNSHNSNDSHRVVTVGAATASTATSAPSAPAAIVNEHTNAKTTRQDAAVGTFAVPQVCIPGTWDIV